MNQSGASRAGVGSVGAGPVDVDGTLAVSLRADLAAAGFTAAGLRERLGATAAAALARDEPVPALVALADVHDLTATLIRCFLLGRTVSRRELAAALPGTGVDRAAAAGLVETSGADADDPVRALVDLQPQAVRDADGQTDLWFASDLPEMVTGAPLPADHVLGVGEASLSLLRATVPVGRLPGDVPTFRSPPEPGCATRVLDLGTGCGVQAVHAARQGGVVTATDVSARALRFAAFNAALNGTAVTFREGSLLGPVSGARFDLVVSNPPFVITPRAPGVPVYEYRDGGRTGDALVRDLVLGVGDVLAPGGVAQLLGNWEVPAGQRWDERVGEWLDRSGLDGWVVQRDLVDPAQYAEMWLRDGGTTRDRDPDGWEATYRAWLADLAARDVEAVGLGLITLRRPASGTPTLRRLEEITTPLDGPLGPTVAAALRTHETLTGLGDAALAASRLVVAPDVTEERHLMPGEPDPRVVLLRQGGGFRRTVRVSQAVAGFVGACDGELTAAQIIAALAALLDRSAADTAAEVLPTARHLLTDGFLTFA
ncbi:MAG: methyltransferase [Micrococcales bacterium]|nr:methyltransferase [Micrococcales bacterium]